MCYSLWYNEPTMLPATGNIVGDNDDDDDDDDDNDNNNNNIFNCKWAVTRW